MNITRGKKQTAIKLVVYGPEGVGKTTFASQAPGVVFIDTEGGTAHIDVARTDPPASWAELIEQVKWFGEHPDKVGTVCIDTLDWAEKLAIRDVCEAKKITSIEEIAYGKGYVLVRDRFIQLLEELDKLRARGINIILTAHAQIKKFEQPDEMGSYDRFTLKLNEKNVSPLIKEWSDILLFANFKTDVVTAGDGKTKKARGGQKRVMYTQHSACWDAKNRFGLDDPLPFDFAQVAELFGECPPVEETAEEKQPEPVKAPEAKVETVKKVPEAKKEPPADVRRPPSMVSDDPEKDQLLEQLWQLMLKDKVWDVTVVQAVVAEKEYYDLSVPVKDYDKDFISDVLIEAWEQVNNLCQTKIHDLPF